MVRRISRVLLVSVVMVAPVSAEPSKPESTKVYEFEPVVVEAPRPVTTIGGASAIEVHIDSIPVPVAPSVEEVLRELPLLHVRTNSRGEAEISARGSESRQVAILVDGLPITLAWDARADVSVIPATAIRDVRFTRGLSSMLSGPNVLGGVIEIGVAQPRDQPSSRTMQVTMGGDHVGTFGMTAATSLPFETEDGKWLLRGGFGFRDSPGDPLARGVEEPVPTDDDLRLNTDNRNFDGFLSLRYLSEGGARLSFSGLAFRRERGVAAELGLPDQDARLWRYPHASRTLAVLSAGTGLQESPLGGKGHIEASVGLDRGRIDIDAYTSRAYDEVAEFENARDRTVTLRFLADQSLGVRGDLTGSFVWSRIHHDELIPDGEFDYEQNLMSVGLESVWRLVKSRGPLNLLTVSTGGAYDRARTPKAGGGRRRHPCPSWAGAPV